MNERNLINPNTLEQILTVMWGVKIQREKSRSHRSIPDERQKAVQKTAELFQVTYQTINDALWRRLGLSSIRDFDALLSEWLEQRDEARITEMLKNATAPMEHGMVDRFMNEDYSVLTTVNAARMRDNEKRIESLQQNPDNTHLLSKVLRIQELKLEELSKQVEQLKAMAVPSPTGQGMNTFTLQLEPKKAEQIRLLAALKNVEVEELINDILGISLAQYIKELVKEQVKGWDIEERKKLLEG